MRISLGRVMVVVALALLAAGTATAQDKDFVVAGGWAPQWVAVEGGSTTFPLGVMFNVAVPVAPRIQVVADVGYSHKSEGGVGVGLMTLTGGLRYYVPAERSNKISPFVEGMAGLGYASADIGGLSGSQTGFALGFGSGVDVKTTDNLGIRLQVNYFLNRVAGMSFHEFRFGIGLSASTKLK